MSCSFGRSPALQPTRMSLGPKALRLWLWNLRRSSIFSLLNLELYLDFAAPKGSLRLPLTAFCAASEAEEAETLPGLKLC